MEREEVVWKKWRGRTPVSLLLLSENLGRLEALSSVLGLYIAVLLSTTTPTSHSHLLSFCYVNYLLCLSLYSTRPSLSLPSDERATPNQDFIPIDSEIILLDGMTSAAVNVTILHVRLYPKASNFEIHTLVTAPCIHVYVCT